MVAAQVEVGDALFVFRRHFQLLVSVVTPAGEDYFLVVHETRQQQDAGEVEAGFDEADHVLELFRG